MDDLNLTKNTVYLDKNGNPLRGAAALQAYWAQNPDEHLAYKDASDEDKEWIRQNALALIKSQQEKYVQQQPHRLTIIRKELITWEKRKTEVIQVCGVVLIVSCFTGIVTLLFQPNYWPIGMGLGAGLGGGGVATFQKYVKEEEEER